MIAMAIHVSIGAVLLETDDTAADGLRRADEAMYAVRAAREE